jgi:hypothetical protein
MKGRRTAWLSAARMASHHPLFMQQSLHGVCLRGIALTLDRFTV